MVASRSRELRRSTPRRCSQSRRTPRSSGSRSTATRWIVLPRSSTSSGLPTARDAFIALLRAGRGAIPVFEALDHVGLLVRLLPEWENVRARPQRNAYHRFTVDRHSLEAVAECAAMLDPAEPAGEGFDGDIARRARADVLLLAALLHDVAKGKQGDHSVVGVEMARSVAGRIRLDHHGTERAGVARAPSPPPRRHRDAPRPVRRAHRHPVRSRGR